MEEGTLVGLRALAANLAATQGAITAYVRRARDEGATWQEIGEALGTSRQAAWQRYGKTT